MDPLIIRRHLEYFLLEDIGTGDITTDAIFPTKEIRAEARFIAKGSFVAAGMGKVAALVFRVKNPDIEEIQAFQDGAKALPGDILLAMRGPLRDLLQAERVALNLSQRLCGIATLTAQFVARIHPLPVRIVDTRKTTPGLRVLEKYAVRVGGGKNHRLSLSDGILIKDNHIAGCGSISVAVAMVRSRAPHTLRIQVEATTIEEVKECLANGIDAILLDNMSIAELREAVAIAKGKVLLEASGGVCLDNVRAIAETGVDLISIGALTHSAPAADISMDIQRL